MPPPRPSESTAASQRPGSTSPPTSPGGSSEGATATDMPTPFPPETAIEPIAGPSASTPSRRKLVVTGAGTGGGGGAPLATEDVTFKMVEAFEQHEGRFTIRVSHLH